MNVHDRMRKELQKGHIFQKALAHALEYLEELPDREVFPSSAHLTLLNEFDEELPEDGGSGEAILEKLHEYGSPNTVAQGGGRYYGFVNGGIVPAALAARILTDFWDQNAGLYLTSPIASKLEEVTERWMVELLGLPKGSVMGLVTGTTTATMLGIASARYDILRRQGWDVNSKGLFGAPAIRVVISEGAHSSVIRALIFLGLGSDNIELVPADSQGRLDPTRLPPLDSNTLLILQAGNVNTGAFDDFQNLCDTANRAGAWVHIDGAFGLWGAASSRKHLTAGIEKADSWSVDGHKTLNTPYDLGIVLCRNQGSLVSALETSGAYLHLGEKRDGMRLVAEMSRRARSIDLWSTLRFLGRRGVAELVDELCNLAEYMASLLTENGFEVLNEVVFNQVLFISDTEESTRQLLERVQQSGKLWFGSTVWKAKYAIRVSVCSWYTNREDIERSVEVIKALR